MIKFGRFVEEGLLIVVKLDIVIAVFRYLKTGQSDVADFTDLGAQMPYRFFDRRRNAGVELFKEVFAWHTQPQVRYWLPKRLRVAWHGLGWSDGIQWIVASEYLEKGSSILHSPCDGADGVHGIGGRHHSSRAYAAIRGLESDYATVRARDADRATVIATDRP